MIIKINNGVLRRNKTDFFPVAVAPTGVVTCLFAPHFAVLSFWSLFPHRQKYPDSVRRSKIHQIISSRIPAVLKKEMFEAGTNLMFGPRSRSRPSESKADILPPLFVVGRKEGGGCRWLVPVPLQGTGADARRCGWTQGGWVRPRGLVRRWPRSSRAASRSSSPGQDPP